MGDRTVEDYISLAEQFLAYLDATNKEDTLELNEIQTRHVREFLIKKRKQDKNELSTINKNLTILKKFFNFLWESKQIAIDPTTKLKHKKIKDESSILLPYEMLLDILPGVIKNNSYSNLKKIIYILALHGFRVQDYHILKKEIIDKTESVMIFPKTHEPIELYGVHADIFIAVYNDSLFNSSPYVFTTKRKKEDKYVPIEVMGIYKHLSDIKEDYNLPVNLNTNSIRHSYAFYLYFTKGYTFERIADILGIENYSAALLVRESEKRMKKANERLEI
jgi:site-specific recombinase XerD